MRLIIETTIRIPARPEGMAPVWDRDWQTMPLDKRHSIRHRIIEAKERWEEEEIVHVERRWIRVVDFTEEVEVEEDEHSPRRPG